MRRTNLIIASASASAGALALFVTATTGGEFLGLLLGTLLLSNAVVRYQLAQRRGR